MNALKFYLILYVLILLGYIFRFGVFTIPGIFILLLSLLLWWMFYLKPKLFKFSIDPYLLSYIVLVISIALSLYLLERTLLEPGIPNRPPNFLLIAQFIRTLLAISLIISIFLVFMRRKILIIVCLILFCLLTKILIIIASPNPQIDVYDFVMLGTKGLMNGVNPYSLVYTQMYVGVKPDYFSYGPGIFFFTIPFKVLGLDHRFSFVTTELATSIILLGQAIKIKKGGGSILLLPLIFLFNPITLYINLRGWIDPSIIFLFLLSILAFTSKNKVIAMFLLGIAISIKQTMIFAPLFFYKIYQKKFLLVAFIVSTLIYLPFLIWGQKDFFHDLVYLLLYYPPIHVSLSVNSMFYFFFGKDIPQVFFLFIWISTLFLILKKDNKDIGLIFPGMSLWFFTFYFFNKFTQVNYYYFFNGLIILCAYASVLGENKTYKNTKTRKTYQSKNG